MATKRKPDDEPDREIGIPEETGPTRQEPTPLPITSEGPPPPPLPQADATGVVLSASSGVGRFHQIVSTEDVPALVAIATAAHAIVQAGGLSTNDRRIARLHADLTTALYDT